MKLRLRTAVGPDRAKQTMTREVIEQLAAVRESGAVNMLDRNGVQRVANECGFDELVTFIDENSTREYSEALKEMGRSR